VCKFKFKKDPLSGNAPPRAENLGERSCLPIEQRGLSKSNGTTGGITFTGMGVSFAAGIGAEHTTVAYEGPNLSKDKPSVSPSFFPPRLAVATEDQLPQQQKERQKSYSTCQKTCASPNLRDPPGSEQTLFDHPTQTPPPLRTGHLCCHLSGQSTTLILPCKT
jgi:hypothetical protein